VVKNNNTTGQTKKTGQWSIKAGERGSAIQSKSCQILSTRTAGCPLPPARNALNKQIASVKSRYGSVLEELKDR